MFPLVEFKRPSLSNETRAGFVIESNDLLTLVQIYDTQLYQLNGWAVFLNSDARKYREVPSDVFLARTAKHRKLKPEVPQGVSIQGWKDVLATAGSSFPLLTIYRERIKRNSCWIGKLRRISQRAVTLRSISPEAIWERDERYLLSDITMVEFGGAYERILDELAEQPCTSNR